MASNPNIQVSISQMTLAADIEKGIKDSIMREYMRSSPLADFVTLNGHGQPLKIPRAAPLTLDEVLKKYGHD